MFISIILWFVFGMVAGIGATTLLYKGDNKQVVPLIILGTVGALVGGSFGQIMARSQAEFNPLSPIISLIGAIALISLYKNISPQS